MRMRGQWGSEMPDMLAETAFAGSSPAQAAGNINRQFKRLPGALHAEPGHARSAFASACQRALTTLSANFRLLAV
jgi:hypothetical protein